VEEFGRLVLKGMADKLGNPADQEEQNRPIEERPKEYCRDEENQTYDDQGNAERMARPVHRMTVAGCVLRDPFVAGSSA